VTEYSEKEQHMLAAYARYQKYVNDKNDKELPNILYHRAKLMMEHHRFDEAQPVLEVIVKKFDGSRYSATSMMMARSA
jgi:outer membrane protein assembly factor BamD (BamD/ComL family)